MNILIDGHDITLVGGIERFTANLTTAMTQRGHKVFLFTYAPEGSRHQFFFDPDVHLVHYLFTGDPAHIPALRQQILACRPDVLVSPASFNNHLLWCAALAGTGIPWVYSERSDPWIIEQERWDSAERAATLSVADSTHLLLPSFVETMPHAARDRVRVIPNPLALVPERTCKSVGDTKAVLSLGRLDAVKQLHILIDAFALLCGDFPQWRLEIWGEGEERTCLQRLIERERLWGRTNLRGLTSTPEQQYAVADIFCLPSRYEGFPNTVIEAQAHGLPVVGFAGCAALNKLVRHGETGLLAPEMTAESLASSLRTLMSDADLRRKMGENARVAASAYAPERIFDAWEALLADTAACKGHTRLQECLAGQAQSPELDRQYAVMRTLLRRKNVLLKDGQWLRRLVRRYPPLRKKLQSAKRSLALLKGKKP
ncbi:MAG: glycosyltransferase [Desulfovibrio sp.]|nr:glycosyltransferase [Desulfovibrio sp.]